jgi:hypothetical protein
MGDSLRRWFARPPEGSPPADVLRWTRRVSLTSTALGLVAISWLAAIGDTSWWVPVLIAVPALYTLLVFPRFIRSVERRTVAGTLPPPTPRERRVGIAGGIAWILLLPGLCGLVVGGPWMALAFAGAGGLGAAAIGFHATRRKRRGPE